MASGVGELGPLSVVLIFLPPPKIPQTLDLVFSLLSVLPSMVFAPAPRQVESTR